MLELLSQLPCSNLEQVHHHQIKLGLELELARALILNWMEVSMAKLLLKLVHLKKMAC